MRVDLCCETDIRPVPDCLKGEKGLEISHEF